ncbi:pyridoxamine 5'-phosphate oxidase family protein [Natrialbaceae archaeon AArc-T1-2]|uniref:pyridoxamine 5'-phosphate oxidase family protein n=1 Tax=Natrialbaceae archaeon AArc-T1-2 TaxID=3053904 RepID=UPI00255ABFD3|nr:pyridoxamine 5'-phosphate oxidase family protein [Natrialbaceae archaeon AArc-T1-2]WIV67732.1 pyridoxamine 5'-phosphate oxidase family protein [Natrialbaceae archaeon AArc-T1-2]
MSHAEETAMTATEIDSCLGRHETGVLGLARDDEPYAIPISYGYDADERTVYLRLVSTPDSEKRRFLGSRPRARLVVYDRAETEPIYRSAVAAGPLEELPPEELTVDHVEQYGDAKRPLFEIWGEPTADLDIRLYELEPDELSGRRVEIDR